MSDWTRVDENNLVRFKLTYMGSAFYRWYKRDVDEEREIKVRYLEPDDYERSIRNPSNTEPIPAVGTITCIGETIPKAVIEAMAIDSTWESIPRIAGYNTVLSA